jgi:hypothetical protein
MHSPFYDIYTYDDLVTYEEEIFFFFIYFSPCDKVMRAHCPACILCHSPTTHSIVSPFLTLLCLFSRTHSLKYIEERKSTQISQKFRISRQSVLETILYFVYMCVGVGVQVEISHCEGGWHKWKESSRNRSNESRMRETRGDCGQVGFCHFIKFIHFIHSGWHSDRKNRSLTLSLYASVLYFFLGGSEMYTVKVLYVVGRKINFFHFFISNEDRVSEWVSEKKVKNHTERGHQRERESVMVECRKLRALRIFIIYTHFVFILMNHFALLLT